MKLNPWTVALVGAGIVSLPSVTRADEKIVPLQTAIASTTLSGYVDTSAQWNIGTGNANLPPYAFGGTSKADGFNLNVVKLQLEKPIDPAEIWGAGYKVDLLAGPDADTFSTQSPLATGKSDFAVKQAYVALHAPIGTGLDVKIGVWDTIIGYEVFESGNNPNFTRSYGYTMEPTTHTGILGTYTFCPAFAVNLGIADSFGPTINGRSHPPAPGGPKAESFKTYMGSFTLTAPTNCGALSGSTLTGCVISGYNTGVLGGTGGNETSYYVGASVNTPLKGLTVGGAFDYMDVADTSGETWCVGGYLGYHATEKLSFYARGEYLRDRGAQKLFVSGNGLTAVPLAPDKVLEFTGTVQYDLWKNVMTRLEIRWDHSLTGQGIWGGTTANASDGEGGVLLGGDQKNAVAIIANVIYKF